jgi:hypothetical protein
LLAYVELFRRVIILDSEQYLKERLQDQIDWYDNKSKSDKKWYIRLRTFEIVFAALIPFIIGFSQQEWTWLKFVAGALGVAVTVMAGLLGLFKFQENWVEYRATAETLKHEKFLFLTRTKPYDTVDPFKLLVERVETLVSNETNHWSQYLKASETKNNEKKIKEI